MKDLEDVSILCPETDKLNLYGDNRLYNYTGITVDFEYCFESKAKEECYSEEQIEELIDKGVVEFQFQMEYK